MKFTEPDTYSGATGVYWDSDELRWRAQVFHQGRTIHVGLFDKLEDAIKARERVKRIYGDSRRIPPRPKSDGT
jgi:hypothetical protein